MPKLYLKFKLDRSSGEIREEVVAAVDLNRDRQVQKPEQFDLKQNGLTWTGTKDFASPAKVGGLFVVLAFDATPGAKFEVEVRNEGPDGVVLAEGKDTVASERDMRLLYLREVNQ
jgi:hypothetical protein